MSLGGLVTGLLLLLQLASGSARLNIRDVAPCGKVRSPLVFSDVFQFILALL